MKKTLVFIVGLSTLFILLVVYSFYPLFTSSENTSDDPVGSIYITDRNGEVITDKALPGGYYKEYEYGDGFFESRFISSLMIVEDKNYLHHWGVNVSSKIRAFIDNMSGEKVSGGSTITEQYIKNRYFREYKRGYLQKLREAILALYFTQKYSKEYILTEYLDTVYFGNQVYGIGAALEIYFENKRLEELNDREVVLLLGLLHAPSTGSTTEKYFSKYLSRLQQRLNFPEESITEYLRGYKKKNIDLFPHVTLRAIKEICGSEIYNYTIIKKLEGSCNKNLNIVSTIDASIQKESEEIINYELSELVGKNVTNAAAYGIIPHTKEILVYIGSKDFYAKDIEGEVNVIESLNQPGSTVKPFLYLQALKFGMNPDDLLVDVTNKYNSFQEGKSYISENYSLKEYGLVRLKKALGNSLNNATVRLGSGLGLEKVYEFYKTYGFDFSYPAEHYGFSLVLGNADITLANLVENYVGLLPGDCSNNGCDKDKFLLQDILTDPDNRDISFGVESILNTSIPQAVKTGTSSEFRDNVIVSYHPDLVLGLWVGNNDNSSMIGITGISGAGNMWHDIIEALIQKKYMTNKISTIPKGIVEKQYCLDTLCYRKEYVFMKEGKQYFSKIVSEFYSKKDILQKLSIYEKERLKNMNIIIQNN